MAKRNKIRLLVLDVDGTLAARADEITPRTRAALHRAWEAGIEIVIATGRRYRSTRRVIAALGLPVRAVVLGGALVKEQDGSTLYAASFGPAEFESLYGLARSSGHSIVCQLDSSESGGPDFLVDGAAEWNATTTSYFRNGGDNGARHDDLAEAGCPEALAIGVFGRQRDLNDLGLKIQATHGDRFLTSVIPARMNDDWYFELVPAGVSKWSGICAITDLCEIPRSSVCAVGDQRNDLPMIRQAGLGIAMGNAPDDVKAAASWVTRACDDDGLVAVVDRVLAAC